MVNSFMVVSGLLNNSTLFSTSRVLSNLSAWRIEFPISSLIRILLLSVVSDKETNNTI